MLNGYHLEHKIADNRRADDGGFDTGATRGGRARPPLNPRSIALPANIETERSAVHVLNELGLAIPAHPELRKIIDATPSGHLTFLVTEFGRPFTSAGFGNWFRDQCNMAGLHHCTFHGLRKAVSVRLAEHGCTSHEIAAITGDASLAEVERYTRTASRKLLARSAMDKLRTSGGKP